MAKTPQPFTLIRRSDSKSYRLTLNPSCGLSAGVCREWYRRSFQHLPAELADYRNPKLSKNDSEAKAAAYALIQYLKKKQEEGGSARRVATLDITVGGWIEKFTSIETSPRTGVNASKNKPYSLNTIDTYKSYFVCHIKDDPLSKLKMTDVEKEDILEYSSRLSVKTKKNGNQIGGTRTFAGVIAFLRLTFNEYQRINQRQSNPFQFIAKPVYYKKQRDALTEEEMLRLFYPGVLEDAMELAVCAAIFLSGLRRGEVSALKPEDLDWVTPKIVLRRSWQRFNTKNKVMGPTKGKKTRNAPFDPVLQAAIKKLWEENGRHDFVFCDKKGRIIGSKWIEHRFKKWLERAEIELGGRSIVPHSSRHSLASLLEKKGVSLRYIQELLGHSDLKTTIGYLHSTEKTIRDIGMKIVEAREKGLSAQKDKPQNIVDFKAS